jgi:hypothetical protein
MSPKAKAKELYSTYIDYTFGDFNCKQCALIAVDEILKINWYHSEPTCFDDLVNEHKEKSVYWNEVKEEIEKL